MLIFKFTELIGKLLSFKFVIFVISTVLRIFGVIDGGQWLAVTLAVLGAHSGMKSLYTIMDRKTETEECGG